MAIRTLRAGSARIPTPPTLQTEGTPPTFTRASIASLQSFCEVVSSIFAGGISAGDGTPNARMGHLDWQFISGVKSSGANVEFIVPHGLQRAAIGVIPVYADKAGVLYCAGRGAYGRQNVRLKSSVANTTFDLIVF